MRETSARGLIDTAVADGGRCAASRQDKNEDASANRVAASTGSPNDNESTVGEQDDAVRSAAPMPSHGAEQEEAALPKPPTEVGGGEESPHDESVGSSKSKMDDETHLKAVGKSGGVGKRRTKFGLREGEIRQFGQIRPIGRPSNQSIPRRDRRRCEKLRGDRLAQPGGRGGSTRCRGRYGHNTR